MAHFTYMDSNNIVERTVVVMDSKILDENGDESEAVGIAWLQSRGWNESGKYWKQCSYNTVEGVHRLGGTPFRKNYPQEGWTYNASADAFNPPKPFASWILNGTTGRWNAPIAVPADDFSNAILVYDAETDTYDISNGPFKYYTWDESAYQADNTEGWVEA